MGGGAEKSSDFYAVLGLKKECSSSELRNAYKKLAMRWHPDRCSASGNSKFVEEAKKKFQAIQEAYSVLSDDNKRFLYDVGVYDSDDDENGMGDFLNEMAAMMSQTKPNENGNESFEQLQELFDEMFQVDADSYGSSSNGMSSISCSTSPSSSSYGSYSESSSTNKRNSADMSSGKANSRGESSGFDACFQNFSVGAGQNMRTGKGVGGRVQGGAGGNRRRHGRKQKVSSGQDVSSNDYSGIST